jgi:hypothetical protein
MSDTNVATKVAAVAAAPAAAVASAEHAENRLVHYVQVHTRTIVEVAVAAVVVGVVALAARVYVAINFGI